MTGAISVGVAIAIALIIHSGSLDNTSYVFDDDEETVGGCDGRK
jgi:capsular polysaccharide biosynthesis protein